MLLTKILIKAVKLSILAVLLLVVFGIYHYKNRPGMAEYNAHIVKESAWNGLRLKWLGTASILIEDGETTLLIDPYFSRPSFATMFTKKVEPQEKTIKYWLEVLGIKKVDAILVSHSHIDHVLDVPSIAKKTDADILGSASTAYIAQGGNVEDVRIRTVEFDTPYTYGKFTIRFIKSKHGGLLPATRVTSPVVPPVWTFNYGMGEAYSILIEHPQGTLLHHASAGFILGALENYKADTVLLGIAMRPKLRDYITNVVEAVGAKSVIPIHWDDFSQPLTRKMRPLPAIAMDDFFEDMQEHYPDIKLRSLPFNVPVHP